MSSEDWQVEAENAHMSQEEGEGEEDGWSIAEDPIEDFDSCKYHGLANFNDDDDCGGWSEQEISWKIMVPDSCLFLDFSDKDDEEGGSCS